MRKSQTAKIVRAHDEALAAVGRADRPAMERAFAVKDAAIRNASPEERQAAKKQCRSWWSR
jgi:hypothetical protein